MSAAVTSRRFDSTDYTDTFKRLGAFPQIHGAIYQLIAEELTGSSVLDLCCSTGLLGERIRTGLKVKVCGVDRDVGALLAGEAAGVAMPVIAMPIVPAAMPGLIAWVKLHGVDTLVARRCFPELFGDDHFFGRLMAAALRGAGVREVFLQGRQPTPGATTTLPTVYREAELFEGSYRVVRAVGQCIYMKARD